MAGFTHLSPLLPGPAVGRGWGLPQLTGRLVELSGRGASARLTAAFGLVLEAQRRGNLVAWVGMRESTFFPPDAADGGVDLETLTVVRVENARTAGRAADPLVRSGGFRLVVLDLDRRRGGDDRLPAPLLNRLMGLAQKHATTLLILTEKAADAPSLSSIVSLRAEAERKFQSGAWEVRVSVLKDKHSGPGTTHVETCRGPAGLR